MPAQFFERWFAAILLTYAIGFCVFYPNVFTTSDESLYVEQAMAFARGSIALRDGVRTDIPLEPMSNYPPATSLLQTPFVLIGGWRAAAWASVLSLVATVLVLARWLREAGYSSGFALLFLAYAPTLVVGRLAQSDVPSAAVVTLGLWLFWTGAGSRWKWFLAGLLAGLSLLFRETNVLIFVPFFVAAVVRGERHWKALVAGAAAGAGGRLLVFQLLFGSPLFMRSQEGWSLAAAVDAVPLYALALLVLVPGGLIAVAIYRGQRRGELIAAVALFLAVYVFANYSGQSSEPLPRLGAAGRYLIPLVPLITFAWADAVSRQVRSDRLRALVPVACAAMVIAAFAVHPVIAQWSAREADIVRDIYASTADGGALVADDNIRKYISPAYGRRARIWMADTPANELAAVTKPYPSAYIVVVSRFDTALMAEYSSDAETYLDQARLKCQLEPVLDRRDEPTRRLRIWHVRAC